MKLLILADTHANLEALNAIREDYDKMLFLGDVVDYGPSPQECIEFVKNHAYKIVRGNHDNAVAFRVDCRCGYKYKHLSIATREYMWKVLDEEEIGFLKKMPLEERFKLGGYEFYMTHASPSDNLFKYITPETGEEELKGEIAGIGADFILLGHSHLPMIKKIEGKTVINPGSIGQPRDGIAKVSYAVIEEGGVEIRRVEYDLEKTVQRLKETGMERGIVDELGQILRRGR
jgi:putative phosphoesterase